MAHIYNQLSEQYNTLFLNHILDFQPKAMGSYPEDQVFTTFYPSLGIAPGEHADFLIIGQATNDWGKPFQLGDDSNRITKQVEDSIVFSNENFEPAGHNPLDWVNVYWSKSSYNEYANTDEARKFYKKIGYQTFRSFFWNVTYKLICKYCKLDLNGLKWTKKMVWSNLYKIAPPLGNPDDVLADMQEDGAVQLIKRELDEIQPTFCVVLTNDAWWVPFRKYLQTEVLENNWEPEIQSVERYKDTLIFVTKRTFVGKNQVYVSQLEKAIRSLSS